LVEDFHQIFFNMRDPLDSPVFRRWFGDSKIINNYKNPLLVYHGTTEYFDEFNRDKFGKGFLGDGIYFSDKKEVAERYTDEYGDTVLTGFVRIENPLDLNNPTAFDIKTINGLISKKANYFAGFGVDKTFITTDKQESRDFYDKKVKETEDYFHDRGKAKINKVGDSFIVSWKEAEIDKNSKIPMKLVGVLINEFEISFEGLGYDGIVAENEMVIFQPNQFKSTGNNGEFNQSDNRFNYQIKNKGLHYGDLGVGKDTTRDRMTYGRSTGHMGTGTYFLGETAKEVKNTNSITNRPANTIDLDEFNLFKPFSTDEAFDFHDMFRSANRLAIAFSPSELQNVRDLYESKIGDGEDLISMAYHYLMQDYKERIEKIDDLYQEETDMDKFDSYEEQMKDLETEKDRWIELSSMLYDASSKYVSLNLNSNEEVFNLLMDSIIELSEEIRSNSDNQVMVSNKFMDKLGYDGIDVRNLDLLDNTTYGSVIFSDKKGKSVFEDYNVSHQIKPTDTKWQNSVTMKELKDKFPNAYLPLPEGSDSKRGHSTQRASTRNTYNRIFDYLESTEDMSKKDILDASSGLGLGVIDGVKRGLSIKDVEPFPPEDRTPTYTNYENINEKFDYVISNAVLNVIPQDIRNNVVKNIGRVLNTNGQAFILARNKASVLGASTATVLNKDNAEVYIDSQNSYQKGFSKTELRSYVQDVLGEGYVVETLKKSNSGYSGFNGVKVTKTVQVEYDNFVKANKNAFQLKPIDDLPELYATHNFTMENLKNTIDLGGFPVPSIAVANDMYDAQEFTEGFGEKVIVFRQSAVDPQLNNKNLLYTEDAFTTVFPEIRKTPVMKLNELKKMYNEYSKFDFDNRLGQYIELIKTEGFVRDTGYSYFGNIVDLPIAFAIKYAVDNGIETNINKYEDVLKSRNISLLFNQFIEQFEVNPLNYATIDRYSEDYLKNISLYKKMVSKNMSISQMLNHVKKLDKKTNLELVEDFENTIRRSTYSDRIIPNKNFINGMLKASEKYDEIYNDGSYIKAVKKMISNENADNTSLDVYYSLLNGLLIRKFITQKENRAVEEKIVTKLFKDDRKAMKNYFNKLLGDKISYEESVKIRTVAENGDIGFRYTEASLQNIAESMISVQNKAPVRGRFTGYFDKEYAKWNIEQIVEYNIKKVNNIDEIKENIKFITENLEDAFNDGEMLSESKIRSYLASFLGSFQDVSQKDYSEIKIKVSEIIYKEKSNKEINDYFDNLESDIMSRTDEITNELYTEKAIKRDVKRLREMTLYLRHYVGRISEAKPLRVIGFDEVDSLIIRQEEYNTLSQEHKDFLEKNDVNIIMKGKGDEVYNELTNKVLEEVKNRTESEVEIINTEYVPSAKPYEIYRTTIKMDNFASLSQANRFINNYKFPDLERGEDLRIDSKFKHGKDDEADLLNVEIMYNADSRITISDKIKQSKASFQLKIPHINFTQTDEMEQLSYPETVAKADISDDLKALLKQKEYNYVVKKNINTFLSALKYLDEVGVDEATESVLDPDNSGTPELFALAHAITAYRMNEGDTREAERIIEMVSVKAKNLGQAIQVLSMWGRYTPEGITRYAKRVIRGSMTKKDIRSIQNETRKITGEMNKINKEAIDKIDMLPGIKEIIDIDDGQLTWEQFAKDWNDLKKETTTNEDLTAEEILAKKVLGTTKEKAKPKEKTALEVMVDTLFKVAQESPLPNKSKSVKQDKIKLIADAIKNRTEYREVWDKAKVIVQEKLEEDGREIEMEELDAYFEKSINRTFPDGKLTQVLKDQMKRLDIKLREVVREHYTKNTKVRRRLMDAIIENTDLTNIEAAILEKNIYRQMKDMTKEAKEKELASKFVERDTPQKRTAMERIVELSNLGAFKNDDYKSLVAEKLGMPSISKETMDLIHAQAQYLQTLEPDSREQKIEIARLHEMIAKNQKKSILEYIDFTQTLAQLLNFKTMNRNLIGNFGFATVETLLTDNVKVPLDIAVSKFTGQRTAKFMPGQKVKAWNKGFKAGWETGLFDALNHIDTSENTTRFDFKSTRMFNKGIMSVAETALNVSLRATDRAFYKASVEEALVEMKAINGKLTDEMVETAHVMGLYRTFQDDTFLSKKLVALKKFLNDDKGFGVGSMTLKYPKTPANLLNRGLDYSPAGFVVVAAKLFADTTGNSYLKQKMAVDGISRAALGTSILAAGAIMFRLGIITNKGDDKEWDIYGVEISTGIRSYQVNLSLLKRYLFRTGDYEVKYGDKLASYDWFQPLAISIGLGADIEANKGLGGVATRFFSAFEAGVESLTGQPLLSNLTKAMQKDTIGEAVTTVLQEIPASFVPSFLSQMQIAVDPTVYQNWVQDDWTKTMMNKASRKIPYLSSKISEPSITGFGEIAEYYDSGNKSWLRRAFDSFFSPAITSEYKPTDNEAMVLDLYESTGETKQAPGGVRWSYKIDIGRDEKVQVNLSEREYRVLSQWVGKNVDKEFEKVRETLYGKANDDAVVRELNDRINLVNRQLKIKLRRMYEQKELSDVELIGGE